MKEGKVLPGNIVKVDSFLNHQLDPRVIREIGREFSYRFKDRGVTKVVTIESSGIAVAIMTGLELNVPVVFAKKQKTSNIGADAYHSTVKSYTRGTTSSIMVSKEYITNRDRILIVDDFLAMGQAVQGLADIIKQGGASLVGAGIVIEKGFQDGGKILRSQGIHIESLAVIKSIEEGKIIFDI